VTEPTTLPGTRPQDLVYDLRPVPAEFDRRPDLTVWDPDRRFRAAIPEAENRWAWKGATWNEYYRRVDYDMLRSVFSFEELVKFWQGDVILSSICYHIEEQHPVLNKVSHCHWRYGSDRTYNGVVSAINGLRRLSMPGFDLRLVTTSRWNAAGWAEEDWKLYIDAGFGLCVYYGRKHVLTVGFAPSAQGVLIAQVQLREKRGNRWLYKLPKHYVDVMLDVFSAAFGDTLWIVDGESAAAAVRRSYGANTCSLTAEDEARIAAIYNKDLAGFDRTEEQIAREGRTYVRLRAKSGTRHQIAA
jgi:hypothetical protein